MRVPTVYNALLAILASALGAALLAGAEEVDTKLYSYLCLESNQDLCLGISPGEGDLRFDPASLFYLQVKSRSGGEASRTDYKKSRWDIAFGNGKIALSRFADLCAVKEGGSNRAVLYPCNQTFPVVYTPDINYGRWRLGHFRSDPDGAGVLELAGGSSQCLTVMKCNALVSAETEEYCDKESDEPAWDRVTNKPSDLRRGAYVRFRRCHNAGGFPAFKNIQVWRQRLDCAIGCTPGLQNDNKCDEECNNAQCDFDNGSCLTKSPTVSTPSPTRRTQSPTSQSPTAEPTPAPTTRFPTTKSPTNRGTTNAPTTATPTTSPTTSTPTSSPTVQCPPEGELEFCGRFGQPMCTQSAMVTGRCTWCLGECRPKSNDTRVCEIPELFDHCLAQCPSESSVRRCRPAMKRRACLARRSNCIFCPTAPGPNKCFPGKDQRVCKRPTLYAHCATASPTSMGCPSVATVNQCLRATQNRRCPSATCVWCGTAVGRLPCRPRSPIANGICRIVNNPVAEAFPNCPQLANLTASVG